MPDSASRVGSDAEYDAIAKRHQALALEQIGASLERLEWSPDRLAAHREARLREILRHAVQNSKWHAERLRGIDLERISESDLEQIPPMTKSDLMDNWDAIATVPGLTLARCEDHLDALDAPRYLDDHFHVVASGGSSGKRGVFAYDWVGWATYYASYVRWLARRVVRGAMPPPAEMVSGFVGAYALTHPTVALTRTFSPSTGIASSFPVTLPLDEIVSGLNALQPDMLAGYASALALLAHEAEAGRLSIAPVAIVTTSEPLLPEMAESIEAAFGVRPINIYGTADAGIVGVGCGEASGMHLMDDELIIEAVDALGRRVTPDERAAKLYVTVLYQHALPMIRYELSDEIEWIPEPCPCGSSFRRIRDIQGRLDDTFVYATDATETGNGRDTARIAVHPHVFRSPLARVREIAEYQVTQTTRGAALLVVSVGAFDRDDLAASIEADLRRLGLSQPIVSIESVDTISRLGVGKLKRFVPLPQGSAA